MKKMAALLTATLALTLTGCDSRDEVTGTLKNKEYESRNCEQRSGLKCKKWDPSEFELTIVRADGTEVELVVNEYDYNNASVNTHGTWKGRLD